MIVLWRRLATSYDAFAYCKAFSESSRASVLKHPVGQLMPKFAETLCTLRLTRESGLQLGWSGCSWRDVVASALFLGVGRPRTWTELIQNVVTNGKAEWPTSHGWASFSAGGILGFWAIVRSRRRTFELYDNSGNGKMLRSDRVRPKIAGPVQGIARS